MTPQSLDMIARLVGHDTVSRHSNLALIHEVDGFLASHGIRSTLIENADKTKASLLATIGPQAAGGVVLSGHTDVVPVDGQAWSSDPFVLSQRQGRLYGRGTCDMKSFIAVALAMVPTWLKQNLQRPIHFALSYDEEIGCLGAPDLIDKLLSEVPSPQAVIVGEPTSMQPVVAHKGITVLRTQVTGHEAHSSQTHRGVSAVMTAARLITFIEDMARAIQDSSTCHEPFDPPCSTVHVGTIQGGTAVNIISRHCEFFWDIRNLPQDSWQHYLERFQSYADSLLPAMRAIAPDAAIETDVMVTVPALRNETGPAQAFVEHLLDDAKPTCVSFVSEAGQYQEKGLSVVLCGPGSIDQAHQPDEYIEVDQVTAYEQFLERLGNRLCNPI